MSAGPSDAEFLAQADGVVQLIREEQAELAGTLSAYRDACAAELSRLGGISRESRETLAMLAIVGLGLHEESLGQTEPAREVLERLLQRGEEWSG